MYISHCMLLIICFKKLKTKQIIKILKSEQVHFLICSQYFTTNFDFVFSALENTKHCI